jgi:hypothetical protein
MTRKKKHGGKNPWAVAKRQHRLTNRQIAMAKEIGLNPKKFGKLGPNPREPWKRPVGEFIEDLFHEKFGDRGPQPRFYSKKVGRYPAKD